MRMVQTRPTANSHKMYKDVVSTVIAADKTESTRVNLTLFRNSMHTHAGHTKMKSIWPSLTMSYLSYQ